ncbi:hypothetical protein [Spirillospora sp. CA-128828]|uniref:hypothetical protein n=1 Tax=Spirillospora sp. CA-128828 TaxID=3240033 RepID=UPI003D8F023B
MPTDPITTILIALAALVLWVMSLLRHPIGTCPRCKGAHIVQTRLGRVRTCKKCAGTGLHRRRGATTVHGLYWTLTGNRQRQQRREDIARRLDARRTGDRP